MEKEEGEMSPASKVSGKELEGKQSVRSPKLLGHLPRQQEARGDVLARLPRAAEGSHSARPQTRMAG